MRTTIALSAVAVLAASGIGTAVAASASASNHHPKRPASEHVPRSVHRVHLSRHNVTFGGGTSRRTVTGKAATRLVRDFDALKTEPSDFIHCDVAGGPVVIVTFRTPRHTWVVTESVCTNVVVTRDGKGLPTLLASAAWEKAVRHDLRR